MSFWFAVAACTVWLFTHASVSVAQEGCIPDARGVPALSGPPQWVGPNVPPGTTRPVVDDPRWVGSLRHDMPMQGGALATQATFRALNSGGFLYLTFQALVDPNDPTLGDSVWLGFGDGAAGSTKHLLTFDLDSATGPGPDAVTPTYFTKTSGGPGGWGGPAVLPAILFDARRWVDTSGSATTRYKWVINLRIDQTTAGLGAAFRMWYAITVNSGGAPVPTTALYQWPFTAVAPESGVLVMSPDSVDPDTWGNATIGSSSFPCIGGISLNPMNIGAGPAPDSQIRTTASNDFFATPDYGSFTAEPGMLTARFRYANWGSTIADMTNAPWIDIDLPSAGIANAGALGTIGFTCIQSATPGPTEATCPIPSAGSSTHQCVLVELSKTAQPPGVVPNLWFSRDSAFRNMDFVPLSRMVDNAEISIRGLADVPGSPTRDVYLHVKTTNMPGHGEKAWKLPREQMQDSRRKSMLTSTGGGPVPAASRGNGEPDIDALRKQLGATNQGPLDELYAKSTYEHLTDNYPTYEVHTFYDTGNKIVVKGETHLLLEPMVPYGYFADHQGDLYGFSHSIAGLNGAVLTQVGPSFYRVHVPNGGSVQVQTTLEAHEDPRGQVKRVHCQCGILGAPSTALSGLLALGAAVSLLGVLALRRRRRQ